MFRGAVVRDYKLHLWFVLNSVFITLLLFNHEIFMKFLVIFAVASSFLLKTKQQIKAEYSTPIPKLYSGLALAAVLGWVVYLFATIENKKSVKIPEDFSVIGFSLYCITMIIVYVTCLYRRRNST